MINYEISFYVNFKANSNKNIIQKNPKTRRVLKTNKYLHCILSELSSVIVSLLCLHCAIHRSNFIFLFATRGNSIPSSEKELLKPPGVFNFQSISQAGLQSDVQPKGPIVSPSFTVNLLSSSRVGLGKIINFSVLSTR